MVQLTYYQQKLKRGYNAKVKLKPLGPGDLVLRKILGNAKNSAWGKLATHFPFTSSSLFLNPLTMTLLQLQLVHSPRGRLG